MTKAAEPAKIYQLKITLKDSRPSIWRRFQVRSDIPLAKLHRIIQEVMGWFDGHLHQFIVGQIYYGIPSREDISEVKDEKKVRLDQILSVPGRRIVYEYDFGDGWEHVIVLEKILSPDSKARYPRCLDGARACPPEDCGGIYGYADFLEAIREPEHEEHEETLEWIGGEFDQEEFDLEAVNQSLKSIR